MHPAASRLPNEMAQTITRAVSGDTGPARLDGAGRLGTRGLRLPAGGVIPHSQVLAIFVAGAVGNHRCLTMRRSLIEQHYQTMVELAPCTLKTVSLVFR